jgi:glyoxylase-like metal-dependent hydrolase (beta-lactamase superfamily II)
VLVRDDDITYFVAGDATYSEANLRNEKTDGVTNNPTLSLETLRAIKRFALQEPTIVLPAHDPDGPTRLATRQKFS